MNFSGVPELGLAQLDPMTIDILNVTQESPIVTIYANFENIDLTGLEKAKIYKISGFNNESNELEIRLKTPLASCVGPYKLTGSILLIPISGQGNIKLVFGK